MVIWLIVVGVLFLLFVSVCLWKWVKRIQNDLLQTRKTLQLKNNELDAKDSEIDAKDSEIDAKDKHIKQQDTVYKELKTIKNVVEAKLYKKLKAAEEKKKNLAKYQQMKKDTRSVKQQAENIVGKGLNGSHILVKSQRAIKSENLKAQKAKGGNVPKKSTKPKTYIL